MANPDNKPDVRPHGNEIELLLHGARVGLGLPIQDRDVYERPPGDVDWDWLCGAAHRNGVVPLFQRFLNRAPNDFAPQTVRARLADECRRIAHRNLLLASRLIRICDLLESKGIVAMPYKGPLLAVSAYGDISLRQYADLDILIRQRDVVAARDLLVEHGYRPKLDLAGAAEKALLRTECHYVLEHEKHRFLVELHWGITTRREGFPLVLERIQDRLLPTQLCGGTVMTAPPEESLLILCVHGSRHLWRRFAWICDIAAVASSEPAPDWERLTELARNLEGERMLLLGLALAEELLGAPFPEKILSRIRTDRMVGALAAEVTRDVFTKTEDPIPVGERWRYHLRMQKRLRSKMAYVFDIATRPRVEDCAILSLPDSLYPLYYVLRPFRLTAQYGFGALRRVLRNDAPERNKA